MIRGSMILAVSNHRFQQRFSRIRCGKMHPGPWQLMRAAKSLMGGSAVVSPGHGLKVSRLWGRKEHAIMTAMYSEFYKHESYFERSLKGNDAQECHCCGLTSRYRFAEQAHGTCKFCQNFEAPSFLGKERLIADLFLRLHGNFLDPAGIFAHGDGVPVV